MRKLPKPRPRPPADPAARKLWVAALIVAANEAGTETHPLPITIADRKDDES